MKTKTRRAKSVDQFEKEFYASPAGQQRISGMARVQEHLSSIRRTSKLRVPTDTITVGIFGDTHFGSHYEDIEALNAYAAACRAARVSHMLHAGDVLEGHRLYRGQEFEVRDLGWEAQSKRFAKIAPDFGCQVHFITGNHDISFKRAGGIAVGPELQQLRPDWVFVGEDSGDVVLETPDKRKVTFGLLHPGGGSSYALSYRPQKIVEAIEGGTKPDVLAIGNYHKSDWLPSYRNVSVLQVGCFQRQTPFMKTKGLSAMVGGWILEIGFGDGCSSQKAQFFPFY